MSKYLLYSFLFLVAASRPASSQDLNSLRDRASRLWMERLQANKTKAADFIEKERRADFPMYGNVREATVTGLEFTKDKSKVLVTATTKVLIPTIGIVDQAVTESWVWQAGNWFVHVEAASTPFQVSGVTSGATSRPGFTFQLVDRKIDLGTHKQGDKITGVVKFTGSRSLEAIHPRGMEGFRVGAIRWIDEKTGEMDFTVDTSLIFHDIEESIVLEGIGPERVLEVSAMADKLTLVGRIEGRIRISQLPQTPEDEKGRFIPVEIQNLGKDSFTVESIHAIDGNLYFEASSIPAVLAPGQTFTAKISYLRPGVIDGELVIQLSEGVLPSNKVLFRTKGAASQSAVQPRPTTVDRAKIDAAVRQAVEDAQRRPPQ